MSFHIIDIETDGIDNPQKLWCIVVKNLDNGEVKTWASAEGTAGGRDFLEYARGVSAWVGHNIIAYDLPIMTRLLPGFTYDKKRVIDTLVTCRLLNYSVEGGNSLEAWGRRLKCPKADFSDFSAFSQTMLDYCIQDVEVTGKLYATISPYLSAGNYRSALRLEHDTAFLCNDLHDNGFYFDIDGAKALHLAISESLGKLVVGIRSSFPRRVVPLGTVNPRLTAKGTLNRSNFRFLENPSDLTQFNGGPFSRVAFEPFNPGSPKQCVEQLWRFGWRPTDKTKGHIATERELAHLSRDNRTSVPDSVKGRNYGVRSGLTGVRQPDPDMVGTLRARLEEYAIYGWKVNETNLATLPSTAPKEAHDLVEWLMLNARRSTLEEWFEAYNPETHRIHGRFNHIGAWTGRMSHNSPNMANIPGHGSPYGDEFRALWMADPGKYLVGVDADGIQLRVLAHYMNDQTFIKALTEGRKEDGTDAHTLNKTALGAVCTSRDTAKTFIYAFLLGAGIGKISEILSCSHNEAQTAVNNFLSYYAGLRTLKDDRIPADASRGYFIGLDGRAVACDSEHLMLAGYLQNGEAVIMKTANQIWYENLRKEGIPFKQVNFVHDEWQVEVNSLTDAEKAGNIMVSAIIEAGKRLNLNCPLDGNAKIGKTWLDTH